MTSRGRDKFQVLKEPVRPTHHHFNQLKQTCDIFFVLRKLPNIEYQAAPVPGEIAFQAAIGSSNSPRQSLPHR